MKDTETKNAFISLRAQGKSYSAIAKELNISKTACFNWNKELRHEVEERKREELEALFTQYGMTKKARIERLGKTLQRIDEVLELTDFSAVPPEKLLEFKLKYTEALTNEYVGESPLVEFKGESSEEVLRYLGDLLARVRMGDATKEQAMREVSVVGSFLKAYEQTELKTKLEAIESVLETRK